MATKSVKATSKVKTKAKTTRKAPTKLGRNSDGTFAIGNQISKNNNGGRPTEDMSFRQQVKIRATNDPTMVKNVIDNLFAIASDPTNPRCIDAADKLIKMNGNYDPTESRTQTELSGSIEAKTISSPLSELSRDDLKKLLKR